MTFTSRKDAGLKLGQELLARRTQADVILGLPRGGVIVAAEIARPLNRPLDILAVRKIGHPRFREFAVGALAEAGTVVLDQAVVERTQVDPGELNQIIEEESRRLGEYSAKFDQGTRPQLASKSVILVDDGLATGATMEAAVRSARAQGAQRILVAVPVASTNGFNRLSKVSDEVLALLIDPAFQAVGQYYGSFPQATDEEVKRLLASRS